MYVCVCVCVCVCVVLAGVLSVDGLACYCCCTVLAFVVVVLYSMPSSGRIRGSCLMRTSLL